MAPAELGTAPATAAPSPALAGVHREQGPADATRPNAPSRDVTRRVALENSLCIFNMLDIFRSISFCILLTGEASSWLSLSDEVDGEESKQLRDDRLEANGLDGNVTSKASLHSVAMPCNRLIKRSVSRKLWSSNRRIRRMTSLAQRSHAGDTRC